ncbi:hypothetical protein V5R04_14150 [Jonesiaceae bacterium BS-20]|uniref:Uncharacterized protein n=1 Tax=Jonesiaceae bacterium BS-20 TaxID=3120821 RepID=A0AAU7DTQ4_9MICO
MDSNNDVDFLTVYLSPNYCDTADTLEDLVYHASSGLSGDLLSDLRWWARSYRDLFDENQVWKSPDHMRAFKQTGTALARRIADELGSEHEVEFWPLQEGEPSCRFHSVGPATNPRAAAAFSGLKQRLRDEEAKKMRQIEIALGEGFRGSFGWFSSDLNSAATKDFEGLGEE